MRHRGACGQDCHLQDTSIGIQLHKRFSVDGIWADGVQVPEI